MKDIRQGGRTAKVQARGDHGISRFTRLSAMGGHFGPWPSLSPGCEAVFDHNGIRTKPENNTNGRAREKDEKCRKYTLYTERSNPNLNNTTSSLSLSRPFIPLYKHTTPFQPRSQSTHLNTSNPTHLNITSTTSNLTKTFANNLPANWSTKSPKTYQKPSSTTSPTTHQQLHQQPHHHLATINLTSPHHLASPHQKPT
jgi:hypothetical protein